MADSQRKTANLFSIDMAHDDYSTWVYHYTISGLTPNNRYTCSSNFVQSGSSASIWFGGTSTGTNGVSDGNPKTMTSNANGEIDFYINHNTGNAYSQVVNGTAWVMVNEGSQPLPYEPYGWLHSLRKLTTATDTLTTLPADLYADGTNATVGLVGNMSQSGTPTPTTPIQPSETGERTGNLFDGLLIDGLFTSADFDVGGVVTVYKSIKVYLTAGTYTFSWGKNVNVIRLIIDGNHSQPAYTNVSSHTITSTTDGYVGISFRDTTSSSTIWDVTTPIMLNTGSSPLPYQPYGYKLDIKSANTTTPVYLGQVQSTRKIKKLVLTGQEAGWVHATVSDINIEQLALTSIGKNSITDNAHIICTHYIGKYANEDNICIILGNGDTLRFYDNINAVNNTTWATYLQQQYANGTPVTVWYVLAEETTGVVNEPIRKIGGYADTVSGITIPTTTGKDSFDVLTTLKPSEVSLAYTGWHDASAKEWDGSEWQ